MNVCILCDNGVYKLCYCDQHYKKLLIESLEKVAEKLHEEKYKK
jgi:hypothetical protein